MRDDLKKLINYNQDTLDSLLFEFCDSGDLDGIRFILTDSEMIKRTEINIGSYDIFKCLNVAIIFGQLEVVKFFLTSPDLQFHPNPKWNDSLTVKTCCMYNRKDILEYLLESPNIYHRPNIHATEDDAFKLACQNKSITVLEYLILDYNILKTINIERYLHENPNPTITNMFKIRQIHRTLSKELPINENNQVVRVKI